MITPIEVTQDQFITVLLMFTATFLMAMLIGRFLTLLEIRSKRAIVTKKGAYIWKPNIGHDGKWQPNKNTNNQKEDSI